MTTRSTEEAMHLLALTRWWLIQEARRVARELILRDGETHSRAVLEEMARQGLKEDLDSVKGYWLGAVFRRSEFQWTGRYYEIPEEEVPRGENTHSWHPMRIWKLK